MNNMRQIKFRAWWIDDDEVKPSKMHEWNEINPQSMMWLNRKSEFTYMQFTGLLDKNGKEIYEGDILQLEDTTNPEYRYKVHWIEGGWWPTTPYDNCEIIGNIYENKNLLNDNE